jgi:multiple antibiotic resistance protein
LSDIGSVKGILSFFLFAFASLFTVVNPFGAMPVFASITSNSSKEKIRLMARKACFIAAVTMISFALLGDFLFKFFHVSIDGLRVVGGILFFITGYDMLQGKEARTKSIDEEDKDRSEDSIISPLAIPLICGPGAITASTVLAEAAKNTVQTVTVFFNIIFVCFLTYFFLVFSKRIMSLLGTSGNKVFFRLMGLIIMMIAIEFFFSGITPFLKKILI